MGRPRKIDQIRQDKTDKFIVDSKAEVVHIVAGVKLIPGANFVNETEMKEIKAFFDYLDKERYGADHLRPLFVFNHFKANEKGKIAIESETEKQAIVAQILSMPEQVGLDRFLDSLDGELLQDERIERAIDRKLVEFEKRTAVEEANKKANKR